MLWLHPRTLSLPLQNFSFFLLIDSEITLHKGQLEESLCTPPPSCPNYSICYRKWRGSVSQLMSAKLLRSYRSYFDFMGSFCFWPIFKHQDPMQEPILQFVATFPHSLPVSGRALVIPSLSQPGHSWKTLTSWWLEHSSVKACLCSHADSKFVYFWVRMSFSVGPTSGTQHHYAL